MPRTEKQIGIDMGPKEIYNFYSGFTLHHTITKYAPTKEDILMATDKLMRHAFEIGLANADEVILFRTKALRRRTRAISRRVAAMPVELATTAPMVVVIPEALSVTSGSSGVLIAEGDSWFDYPWTDILRLLEDEHGFDVESVAHAGDRVEQMAYSGGQLEEFSRQLEKLIRTGRIPKAILLSGGGNDIAGPEFGILLNHASSAIAGLNEQVVTGVIDERLRMAYITILAAVTQVCRNWLQQPLPILIHGYDYPIPDGRGFRGGWTFLPGPWLEPGFRDKGFDKLEERKALAKKLIDRFNKMLSELVALPQFSHVTYVNLRKTLSSAADYKQSWDNELHPTPKGFKLVTDRFVAVLDSL
jgi:lysophospholipase L1-like esterase